MAGTYFTGPAMAIVRSDPYVSEFEFSSRFHPSKNPNCPNEWSGDPGEDNDEFSGVDSASGKFQRAPDEDSSVGQEPSIEVRAILVRCPSTEEETDDVLFNHEIYNITAGRSQDILDFHGFDRDEPARHSEVRECRRKLIITMKFNNIGRTKTQEEFVVIDHVLDPVTMHKARLLNPFVVKVRQEPVLQLYGLKLQGVVNAEAREEVINKKISNYTGCDDVSENPTCGQMIYQGKPIPYSQGFCCSCDPELNLQRESFVFNESVVPPLPGLLSETKDRSIIAFKSSRSVNENSSDRTSELNEPFAENDNFAVTGNPYDDEIDLIRLKSSNGINKENVTSTASRFKNSGHDIFTAELGKLEQDYRNLRISNAVKIEDRNNESDQIEGRRTLHPSLEKYSGHNPNYDRSDNFASTERMENAITTKIYNDHEDYISTSGNADKLPLTVEQTEEDSRVSTLSIAVLFAIRPKQKSTTSPAYSTAEFLTTQWTEPTTTQPPLKLEAPDFFTQKLVSDRVDPSTSQSNKIDQQKIIPSSNVIRPTTNLIRNFGVDTDDLRGVYGTFNNAELFNTTHSTIVRSRLRQMSKAMGSENAINASLDDRPRESIGTPEWTTAKLREVNDQTQSFDYPTGHEERLENSSLPSLSSGNHSRGDAILLRGLLKDQLANWFSHERRNGLGRRRGRKKSRKDIEKHDGIRYDGRVGFFESAVPTTKVDDFTSHRRYDDQLTTNIVVREPLHIHLQPNDFYEKYETETNKLVPQIQSLDADVWEKTFVVNSDRKDLPVPLWNKSERTNISRSYRSIADVDSFDDKDSDQQRSIDKKIEDKFVDISEVLKDAADSPNVIRGRPNSESNFEKDDSVIEKLNHIVNDVPGNSAMENHLKIADNSIVNPTAAGDAGESAISRYSEGFLGTEMSPSTGHDQPVDILNSLTTHRSRETDRQKLAMDSDAETDNARIYELSPIFSDLAKKRLSKYDNQPSVDDQALDTADVGNNENESQSKIVKHTEKFNEPVSEIPQTTGHQIVVDRFKLVKNYQEFPVNDRQGHARTVPTHSTDVSPNVRHTEYGDSTLMYVNRRNTVSDIFRALSPHMEVDRSEPVDPPPKIPNKKRLQGNVLTHSSFKNIFSQMHNLKEKEFLGDSSGEPIAMVVLDDTSNGQNNKSLGGDLSPVLMIQNLKKELRKEAERYSALSTLSMQNTPSITRNLRGFENSNEKSQRLTTELSPVDIVKETVTVEETLPPDEETKFPETSPGKNSTISPVSSVTPIEIMKIKGTLLPRFAISNFDESSSTETTLLQKTGEMFILVEESLPLSSMQSVHLGNMNIHKKRHWRRHHRRGRRNKRRSMDMKVNVTRDIGPAMNDERAVINGKSENEDDEHPWYETTTNTGNVKNSSSAVTKKSVANIDVVSTVSKKLKRREIPFGWINSIENHGQVDEFSNRATSNSGKLYVSLSRIPESNWHLNPVGLRIQEVPKVDLVTSTVSTDFNVDEARTTIIPSSFKEPATRGAFDELPNFPHPQSVGMNDYEYKRNIGNFVELANNNFQTLSTSRFRSLYPKSNEISLMPGSIVDEVEGSKVVGSNGKREDSINFDESDPKASIFYDYDAADSGFVEPPTASQSDENKRSPKRNLITRKNYFDSRLNEEKFVTNRKPPAVTEARSFHLADAKLRRSGNTSTNKFQIEPPGGWKEKMELLKLKKHADVLKEYLNWRHDIVPPEPHGISGYTTKIPMTNEREEPIAQIIKDFPAVNETTSANTYVTSVLGSPNVLKEFTMAFNSNNDDDINKKTKSSGSSASWSIFSAANYSKNNSFNRINIASMTEAPRGHGHYTTETNISYDNGASTGRILPPCCTTTKTVLTTCPAGRHGNIDGVSRPLHLPEPPNSAPKVFLDEEQLQGKLNNIDNDLVIISLMEKNQRESKKVGGIERAGQNMPKVYRIRNDDAPNRAAPHRSHNSKNKVKHPVTGKARKGRSRRGSVRRLMSIRDLNYRDEEDDPMVDEFEKNVNLISSVDEGASPSSDDKDNDTLMNDWNQLIDKVISDNSSHLWKSANSTALLSPELPTENRSAIKQLHFINADKFIKQLAKKIVHGSNIHTKKHAPEILSSKARNNILLGRRLKSYSSLDGKKNVRKVKDKEHFGNYKESTGGKRSDSKVRSEIKRSHDDPNDSTALYNPARSASSSSSSHQETSDEDQSGRDFAISLSGKIHVEGGTNGQPMSISFDTSPEISNKNKTLPGNSIRDFGSDNSTNPETDPSPSLLSNLFNIAPVPENLAHHSQGESNKSNATISNSQSPRAVDAAKLRRFRKSYRRLLPHQAKKSAYIRRSRAVDEGTAVRWPKYRSDRSFDLENTQDSEDPFEDNSDFADYPDSLYADNNYLEDGKNDDSQHSLPKQRNLSPAYSPVADENVIHQRHNVHDPDVKVIKIIPVNVRKSLSSLPSSDSTHDNGRDENREDTKASIMGAPNLFKMEDDLAPGPFVKPGKIKPAELPWQENKSTDKKTALQDTNASQPCSTGLGSCPLMSQDNLGKDGLGAFSGDNQVSTRTPVSLKVIGLLSVDHQPVTKNPMESVDGNYEIVPLVHVKIQHQPKDGENPKNILPESSDPRGSGGPLGRTEGCPRIEMTKSSEHFHDDDSCSCSETNIEGGKTENNCNHEQPEVGALDMGNDEESRESSGIRPCAEADRERGGVIPNSREDEKFDRMRPAEELHSCGEHREKGTTPKSTCNDGSKGNDARKRIRLKNMLAIVEFMKKIREIMSGEERQGMADTDSNMSVLKLETVVVLPINGSKEIPGGPTDLEYTTERVVMIGEGASHGLPHDELTSNETNSSIAGCTGTAATKDRDKSFLFYENDDKVGAVKKVSSRDRKINDESSLDERVSDRMNQEPEERDPPEGFNEIKEHNAGLVTGVNNTNNIFIPKTDEYPERNSTIFSAVDPNDWTKDDGVSKANDTQHGNESMTEGVLQNLRRKISDRLWGFKNDNVKKTAGRDVDSLRPMKERSVADVNESPSRIETKRDSLRSDGSSYDPRGKRRQIYRSRSLPSPEVSKQLRMQKFRRLSANRDIRKVKRKTKKKKKKKKKRRKKKKHKKKGKVSRDTENSGKPWWPFGRQLMSLTRDRQLLSAMSLDQDQIEEILIEENRNRRAPVALEPRKIRRVHRAKFPQGKKKRNKTRRKHKKLKKKKKKKKKIKGERSGKIRLRSKRQISSGGTQIRGGQNCMDRRHPPNVNPAKYLESAHCLRFSDLWYSIYELEDPIIEHTVYLQLFEKHNRADGTARWEDLTQGSMVRMGSFTKHQRDSTPTIAFTYSGAKTEPRNGAPNLDPSTHRLLVPSPVPPKKATDYPEIRGGSGEYLVVKSNDISRDGSECDKAGVGFAAFSKQKDRCSLTKGSCLKNQPLAYWRHDMRARESGKRGCYFLSNFGSVPTKPIKYNVSGSGSREYLGLEYHSTHVSAIDIEVRTDYNAIVRVGSSGRVTEVYVDSTALEHTVVTVVISNMGLASSPYQPRITDCPTGLPVSWTKAKGIMQVIPPQHDQRVTLDLYGQLLVNEFHCSVEVVNHRGELVAMRRIRVQKMDRCFCVWHCLCACIGSVSGMGCQPMSPEHYHAAGFQGPVPVVTAETSVLMNTVKNVLLLSALLVLILLILGMLKWAVGMFAPAVGRWGLDGLLEGSRIEEYLEPELRCRCVMTDDDGWPVHPDTGQRTVRICSRKLEFFLNLIFFLTYPIAVCCTYCKRSLNSSRQRRCCPDESRMCLINEKGSCPKMICVSTYGDNRNSKLEAEDTRYVIDELKKSQESLQHPKRSKKTDGNKNNPKSLSKKSSHKIKSGSDVSAERFVDDLIKNRMVFRNLREPIGGLAVPSGTTYSLRGYFLNAEAGGYRFITPCPFKQHWLIENSQKKASKPPETYPSNLFMRSYGTARDVYESNELSLNPQGICINVQYQEDEQHSK